MKKVYIELESDSEGFDEPADYDYNEEQIIVINIPSFNEFLTKQ